MVLTTIIVLLGVYEFNGKILNEIIFARMFLSIINKIQLFARNQLLNRPRIQKKICRNKNFKLLCHLIMQANNVENNYF